MQLKPLHHQVVVVIGSSSGIGRAAALGFASKGSKVLVAARSRPGILSLVQEIHKIQSHTPSAASTESHGISYAEDTSLSEKAEGVVTGTESPIVKEFDKVVGMYCDVSNTSNIEEVALKAISKWGRVDTWVHCAGITQFARFTDTTEEEMRRIIDVNFVGACRSAWTMVPKLKQQPGNSSLIFLSSVEARRALPYQSAYSSSKHAMDGMVEALRTELMEDASNINVVSILPSNIDTPFYDKGRQKMPGHFKYVGCPPTYTPEQVANSIMFAACNNTREIVVGDGGYGLTWLQAFVPSALDWVFSKFGDQLERTIYRKEPNEKDNLFTTADPRYDTVRGHWGSRPVPFSLYNAIVENNALKAFVVLAFGVILAFFMYKLLV